MKKVVSLPDKPDVERITSYGIGKLTDRVCINVLGEEIPYMHSHPWNFVSFILWGGYKETRLVNGKEVEKSCRPGSVLYRKHDEFHKVTPLKGKAITLIFKSKPVTSSFSYYQDGIVYSVTKFWMKQNYSKDQLKNIYNKMYNSKY